MKSALSTALCFVINFYTLLFFVRIAVSWFPVNYHGIVGRVLHFIELVTDPILNPIRRIIPESIVSTTRLDFSPMIVIFVLYAIRRWVCEG